MSAPRFRVYWGPDDEPATSRPGKPVGPRKVHVSLGDLLDVLKDAVAQKRAWVNDFTHDEVAISSDLYEVLVAYRALRRPSA